MASVEITDRTEMMTKLEQLLVLDPRQTAIVTVDMHRGHLDMDVATMPTTPQDAERVIAAARDALDFARGFHIPIIHVILTYRMVPGLGSESMTQPFWRAVAEIHKADNRLTPGRSSTVTHHSIQGSRGTEIIPELFKTGDFVVDNKKRLDCFYGTDLDMLLENVGAKNVILMGINTNTCVLNTGFTALTRITGSLSCRSASPACMVKICTCSGCKTSHVASAGCSTTRLSRRSLKKAVSSTPPETRFLSGKPGSSQRRPNSRSMSASLSST